jgi:dTDP-4-amino-4,6-dideoxygalactose transaminase
VWRFYNKLAQLKDMEFRIRRKKEIFNLYRENLKEVGDIQFYPTDLSYVVPWFIDIYSVKRQELLTLLSKENIGTRSFFIFLNISKLTYSHYAI